MASIVIVGGGISGLAAAYDLAKAGLPFTLIEKRRRLGGVISTERVEGCVLESGPDSFLAMKPWAAQLIREIGLGADLIGSNDYQRKTFVLRGGKFLELPEGLHMMVPTRILPMVTTPLVGWGSKIRMGLEWFRRKPSAPPADRSVADFVRDHYGQEAVDYLAEPLLSGVYGGDPRQLSVSSVLTRFVELEAQYGSLTRGVLAARAAAQSNHGSAVPLFQTLKGGLGALVDAITTFTGDRMRRIEGEVEAMEPGYRLRVNGEWMAADHVVLACEAHAAARLLPSVSPRIVEVLEQVGYSSSLILALGFDAAAFSRTPEGFGFLIPRRERKRLVACTFVGNKFDHRVAPGKVVLRCFVGGAGDEAALGVNDESLIAEVLDELRALLPIQAPPAFTRISRWPRSMAQYAVGHRERVSALPSLLGESPGLHLAGNAYHGIGIPDCIRMGRECAARIAAAIR